ncbi:uracil-DNA glycosylase family protein [Snuella sedimenti]|uniref:Uracil-DNA glycosylase-like domain-containing protein n=1 Tax=Snuella sedimenti TaxID=2798802 RepID=A0A8J7J447_9FLAO|nr:uracil-DNA glycosylase family protein [Snuella sedimenti]MBJ6369517.1 hypothetical protein [Snuella sedimenti]
MNKETKIKKLFTTIYGGNFESIKPDYLKSKKEEEKQITDKCHNQECRNKCASFGNRQDIPYLKNIENIKTFVVAESPAKGIDKGKLGHVFGWEYFEENSKGMIKQYENYFFNVLNLNRETTYITDGTKCYSHKSIFSKAFQNCKNYLSEEIDIIKPKEVLVISKQNSLIQHLKCIQAKYNFKLKVIPHPSNQNISKIPTVSEIFKTLGKINNNEKWINLGEQINEEYEILRGNLKR